jgi:hypothetical protein
MQSEFTDATIPVCDLPGTTSVAIFSLREKMLAAEAKL